MKKCSRCQKTKPLSEYSKKKYENEYRSHCDTCTEYSKKLYKLKGMKRPSLEIERERSRKYNKKYPWMSHYFHAKQRCENPNNHRYKKYGARGIKFLLTKENIKFLWFKDKAYELDHPSIDRLDNNGNYEISNCRFIELKENGIKGNN